MRIMKMRAVVALAAVAALCIATGSQAKSPPPGTNFRAIDKVVTGTMATIKVTGVAVGVTKDGKFEFAKGYGLREVAGWARSIRIQYSRSLPTLSPSRWRRSRSSLISSPLDCAT